MSEGSSFIEYLKEIAPWIPGVWAAIRVEQKASQSHAILFDSSGQHRLQTIQDCEKCQLKCSQKKAEDDQDIQRQLQNIHESIQNMTNLIVNLASRLK